MARVNNCFKCHSVEKEKDGLAYKNVAEKYRGKAGAEDRLVRMSLPEKRQSLQMDMNEEHKNIKVKASPESVKNLEV